MSDHIEGALDVDTRGEVEALIAGDLTLAAEHRRLQQTIALLHALPQPESPSNFVGKVRDRLTAERRSALADSVVTSDVDVRAARTGWRRFGGVEAAIGLAAVASVAVFIAVAGVGKSAAGAHGTNAAGVGADEQAVPATIVVPGLPHAVIVELASKAGMDTLSGSSFEGDRRAAGRFLIALKESAAARGVEVSGFVPDAARVRIEVRAR